MSHGERKASPREPGNNNVWAVVLAAGEGARLASVTRFLYGFDLPKQFAALDGDQTLLQRTVDRLQSIVPPHRTVVVVAEERRGLAEAQLSQYDGVQIVGQPRNLGTGPGMLLPLSHIKSQSGDAMVVVTPADHHISEPKALEDALRRAMLVAPAAPAGLALLAADADSPVPDLGWIVPEEQHRLATPDARAELVGKFVEKPPTAVAQQLLLEGGLWNTLVVVGSMGSFWNQARCHMPRQTEVFNRYVDALANNGGRQHREASRLLTKLYRSMPPADFSRTVLQRARGLAVVRLTNSGWCDCGTPERLLACLDSTVGRRHQILKAIFHCLQHDNGVPPIQAAREA